jgi:hypothetical protein
MTTAPYIKISGQSGRIQRPVARSFSMPARRLFRQEGIGASKGWKDMADGEFDSFLHGCRRHVLLDSYADYLERRRLGIERDPEAKKEAARLYAESAAISKARYAPKSGTTCGTSEKSVTKPLKTSQLKRIDRQLRGPSK